MLSSGISSKFQKVFMIYPEAEGWIGNEIDLLVVYGVVTVAEFRWIVFLRELVKGSALVPDRLYLFTGDVSDCIGYREPPVRGAVDQMGSRPQGYINGASFQKTPFPLGVLQTRARVYSGLKRMASWRRGRCRNGSFGLPGRSDTAAGLPGLQI